MFEINFARRSQLQLVDDAAGFGRVRLFGVWRWKSWL
jgi:hypothetical protein